MKLRRNFFIVLVFGLVLMGCGKDTSNTDTYPFIGSGPLAGLPNADPNWRPDLAGDFQAEYPGNNWKQSYNYNKSYSYNNEGTGYLGGPMGIYGDPYGVGGLGYNDTYLRLNIGKNPFGRNVWSGTVKY